MTDMTKFRCQICESKKKLEKIIRNEMKIVGEIQGKFVTPNVIWT